MSDIKLHSIVKLKAEPNSGEMVVEDIKSSYRNFPYATSENPVVFVKFWNPKTYDYEFAQFYSQVLIVVGKE